MIGLLTNIPCHFTLYNGSGFQDCAASSSGSDAHSRTSVSTGSKQDLRMRKQRGDEESFSVRCRRRGGPAGNIRRGLKAISVKDPEPVMVLLQGRSARITASNFCTA